MYNFCKLIQVKSVPKEGTFDGGTELKILFKTQFQRSYLCQRNQFALKLEFTTDLYQQLKVKI